MKITDMKIKLILYIFLYNTLFIIQLSANDTPAGKGGLTFTEAAQSAAGASIELQNAYAAHSVGAVVWALGRFAYFPKLTLTAYEDERLSKHQADIFSKNYTLGVDQLIFDGGRLFSFRKIEKARLSFEENQIERMLDATTAAAVSAYRQVLAMRFMLQIRRDGLQTLLKQRQILEHEVELGMTLRHDLNEADINIAQGKIEIVTAEIELYEIEKQFAESLGLETLPELIETIDVEYTPALPLPESLRSAAEISNPDLASMRLSINQKQEELKFARLSWLPTLHASGNFSLAGNNYPLTHYNWSAGLTLEFSSPWISLGGAASTGMEGEDAQTFRMQGTSAIMPDPVSSMTPEQAKIALNMEREKYKLAFERLGRASEAAVEKCRAMIQKRDLAIELKNLSEKKLVISKLKHELGQLTSIELMEDQIESTKKEVSVIQAVIDIMNAEQELEKLAGLPHGSLHNISAVKNFYR
jgi:outer membrane protein TolC